MSTSSASRAALFVALAACGFGSIGTLVSLATRDGMTLPAILAWRYGLGALCLLALAGGPRAVRLERRQTLRLLVLGGGGQVAVAMASLSSLGFGLPVATMLFLFYTYPAWVALFAALRGERLTRARAVALVLALVGIVAMVGLPGSTLGHPAGVGLALLAALLYALYIPLLGKLQGWAPPAVASMWVVAGATLLLALWAASRQALVPPPTPTAWLAVALLGVACTAVAFILFLRGLAVLGPVRTAIGSTVEPFWGSILGALVLAQPLGPATLVGGALIAAAVVVLARS